MPYKYFSYERKGRPTREETIEVVFDTYLKMTQTMKKLENIFRREHEYRKKQQQKFNNPETK